MSANTPAFLSPYLRKRYICFLGELILCVSAHTWSRSSIFDLQIARSSSSVFLWRSWFLPPDNANQDLSMRRSQIRRHALSISSSPQGETQRYQLQYLRPAHGGSRVIVIASRRELSLQDYSEWNPNDDHAEIIQSSGGIWRGSIRFPLRTAVILILDIYFEFRNRSHSNFLFKLPP